MWDLHTWVLLESWAGISLVGKSGIQELAGFSGCNFVVRAPDPSLDLLDLGRLGPLLETGRSCGWWAVFMEHTLAGHWCGEDGKEVLICRGFRALWVLEDWPR